MQDEIKTPSGNLSAVLHTPEITPAPAIVVTHGFTSSKLNKEEACELLSEAGFVAMRFDFNGHGDSYGDFADFTLTRAVSDLNSAVEFMRTSEHSNGSIGLTGTSLGAQVIMIYASRHSNVKALVAVCPPFKWEETAVMKDASELTKWEKTGFREFYVRTKGDMREQKDLSFSFVLDKKNYDMGKLSGKIIAPTLLVHGDRDAMVPVSHASMYMESLVCEKKLVILPGAGHNHEFTKDDTAAMHGEMLKWFEKYMQ